MWVNFIDKSSTRGVDINNITFTKKTETLYSDTYEHGIGWYFNNGRAWRYILTHHLIVHLSINLLEFVAATITVVLSLATSDKPHKPLSLTDNPSTLVWLHKATFTTSMEVHNKTVRWLTTHLMNKNAALYSQHIPGRYNAIADMLSSDHHISNEQLIHIFHSICPEQTPKNFEIYPLPTWLSLLVPYTTRTTVSLPNLVEASWEL